jgi:hypothetical protein
MICLHACVIYLPAWTACLICLICLTDLPASLFDCLICLPACLQDLPA